MYYIHHTSVCCKAGKQNVLPATCFTLPKRVWLLSSAVVIILWSLPLNVHSIIVFHQTGEIERSDNWKERFRHLNHSSHNYLRITRILKCLGEMEYEHLKAPFLRFVLHEAIVEGTLDRTLDSCMNYWLEVLKDDQERASIRTMANELKSEATETSV